jgi:plasmid replication initiation protein
LEQLRKVLGLESIKDTAGKIIQEAPLPVWANLRQRAINTAVAEINKKTDLNIALESLERSLHRRVTTLTFAIKAQAVPNSFQKKKYQLKPSTMDSTKNWARSGRSVEP